MSEAEEVQASTSGAAAMGSPRRAARKRGKGSLFKRGSIWWFAVSHRGVAIRESTGETDRRKGQAVLDAKLDQFAAARAGYTALPGPEVRQMRVRPLLEALVKDYELRGVRSLRQVKAHLGWPVDEADTRMAKHRGRRTKARKILDAFGNWLAVEVTTEAMDAYITRRLEAGARPATVNRETQLVGQALRPFLAKHRLPAPEIRHLSEDNTREGWFSRAELEALVPALPEHLRDFTRWGYLTGWRKGEIASLTWADVDREGRTIRLSWRKSKNRQARTMALVGELADIIDRRWAARLAKRTDGANAVSEYVFHRHGRPMGDFDKAWATACRAAGCEGKLFHDLRRTGARNLRRAGVPETVAMQVTGHRTRSVFDRYSIVDDADIREALVKVQAHVEALPTERSVVPLRAIASATAAAAQ